MMTNLTLQERRALRKMKHEEWRTQIIQFIPFTIIKESETDDVFVAEESTPEKTNIMLNHEDWTKRVDPTLSYHEQKESENDINEQVTSQLSSPRSRRESYSATADKEELYDDEVSSTSGGGNIGSNKILAWREKRKKLYSKEKEKEYEIDEIQKQEDNHIHELCDEIDILAQHISDKILNDPTSRPARRLSTAKLRGSPSKATHVQRIRFNVMVIVYDLLFLVA